MDQIVVIARVSYPYGWIAEDERRATLHAESIQAKIIDAVEEGDNIETEYQFRSVR